MSQYQNQPIPPQHLTTPPVPPVKRRRWVHWVMYPAVAVLGVTVGALAGAQSPSGSGSAAPTAAASTVPTVTQPAAVETTTTTPTYATPKPKDFHLTIKVKSKQCFGDAGCNLTYQINATWDPTFDPSTTYDVTYEVRGGEDGPVVNTMTVTGDEYKRETDELVSTRSSRTKLSAVVTSVTEG